MKKKAALLMAAMLFATSVPQGSLLSMAAEETEVETELLSEEVETDTEAPVEETEKISETAATEQATEAETVTETEAETVKQETPETEEPGSETVIPEETESEKETEAVTEVTTEEITEKATESETAVVAETSESVTKEQISEEDSKDAVSVFADPVITGISVKLRKDSFTRGIETDYLEGMVLTVSYEGQEDQDVVYQPATFDDGLGGVYMRDNYNNLFAIRFYDSFGYDAYPEEDGLALGNYTIEVYSRDRDDISAEAEFKVESAKPVQSIEVIAGKVRYPANHEEGHFFDWRFKFQYNDGTTSEPLCLNEKDEAGNYVQIEEIKSGDTSFEDEFFSGEKGYYTVKFRCGDIETREIAFVLDDPNEVRIPMGVNDSVTVYPTQMVYTSLELPQGKSGYYGISDNLKCNITVSENGVDIKSIGDRDFDEQIYYLEGGKTYYFSIENPSGYDWEQGTVSATFVVLREVTQWNIGKGTVTISEAEAREDAWGLEGSFVIVPEEKGGYAFYLKDVTGEYENEFFECSIVDKDGKALSCTEEVDSEKNKYVDMYILNAGETYLLQFAQQLSSDRDHLWEVSAKKISDLHAHIYQWVTDAQADCVTPGSRHEECTICHEWGRDEIIPATGNHKFTTVIDRAATCGTAGSQHQECTVCHARKETTTIPATGKHTYGAYKTVKAATVLAAGKEERTCTVCGNKENRSIKKLTAKISVSYKSVSVVAGSSVAGPKVTYAKGDKIASWKTSNKAVATVDKNGKITGKKAGTATITVTLKSKKTAKIKVTVKKKVAATRVKLNKTSLTLKKGKSFQLKATVTPKKTTDKVTYKTSNKNIVTVTSKGKLVAKKKGKATITVTAGKKKATCKVTVK